MGSLFRSLVIRQTPGRIHQVLVDLLPGLISGHTAKMTIGGYGGVNRSAQIQLLNNGGRPQIKMLLAAATMRPPRQ